MGITSVRFSEEIDSGLERAAAAARRTKSWLINEAVRDYLQRKDEVGDRWRDTLAALDQAKHGDVVDGAEVLDWLATWGNKPGAQEKKPTRMASTVAKVKAKVKRRAASRLA